MNTQNSIDPFKEIYKRDLKDSFIKLINKRLNYREKLVIIERYGLLDGISKTLKKIGDILDISKESIRHIEAKALRKLRHPSNKIIIEIKNEYFPSSTVYNEIEKEEKEEEITYSCQSNNIDRKEVEFKEFLDKYPNLKLYKWNIYDGYNYRYTRLGNYLLYIPYLPNKLYNYHKIVLGTYKWTLC